MTTEVQRTLQGILPAEAPAYVEAGDWSIVVAHVRDGQMYTTIAAERGVTPPTIQQRAYKVALRLVRHLAAQAFPDLPWPVAEHLWRRGLRDKEAVSRVGDAELLRWLPPLTPIRWWRPGSEFDAEYERQQQQTLALIRRSIPANKVTCPCCGGSGLVDPSGDSESTQER